MGAETAHNRLSLETFLHPSPRGLSAQRGIAHWTRGAAGMIGTPVEAVTHNARFKSPVSHTARAPD